MVMAILVLIGLYRLAKTFGTKIVESSEKQAIAIEGLTKSIDGFISRDNSEHREIIILQKVMMEKIERMEECGCNLRKSDTGA
jgi:hypothetical protein